MRYKCKRWRGRCVLHDISHGNCYVICEPQFVNLPCVVPAHDNGREFDMVVLVTNLGSRLRDLTYSYVARTHTHTYTQHPYDTLSTAHTKLTPHNSTHLLHRHTLAMDLWYSCSHRLIQAHLTEATYSHLPRAG
jgi:hypothetical protein